MLHLHITTHGREVTPQILITKKPAKFLCSNGIKVKLDQKTSSDRQKESKAVSDHFICNFEYICDFYMNTVFYKCYG